jgi:hypothetical protein
MVEAFELFSIPNSLLNNSWKNVLRSSNFLRKFKFFNLNFLVWMINLEYFVQVKLQVDHECFSQILQIGPYFSNFKFGQIKFIKEAQNYLQ